MIKRVRHQILQENLGNFGLDEKASDDRAQLGIMSERNAAPPAAPPPVPKKLPLEINRPTSSLQSPAEPFILKSPWTIDSPAAFSIGSLPISPSRRSNQPSPSRDISLSSKSDNLQPRLIPKEVVNYRLSANEEWLEKRRQSRLMFRNDFRQSVSSMEEKRVSQAFSDSPTLGLHGAATTLLSISADRKWASDFVSNGLTITDTRTPSSPIDDRGSRTSGRGYDTLLSRQRSQGGSQGSRDSRSNSILQNPVHNLQRTGSEASQDSIFGLRAAPLSPPLSDRNSGADHWAIQKQALATTQQVPGFGKEIESGLEVVSSVDHDNEKMLAYENNIPQHTPTTSIRSIDHPIRHDTSFYKLGGFCEGSKTILAGGAGLKKSTRPVV